ncbi:hypothetical protein GCK72_002000 [Caenorhabditis remanei]|uniref:Major sperm protein n=2 Tax=Caenorhabditis remanei TaxID=31234 RepID=A0A6A5HWH8_CAERE|nr:hypothetical protein GCK72_002000 [Caenorhabditis remanei]KAF1770182.1 hypothetical protein GCK72_002000 [Caenorhabditis remanei]
MAEKKKEEKDSEVFVLKLNPETILFSSSSLGDETTSATLKLTNPTKEKIAFKIKCTSNEMFKIKVPVGLLKPDEITEIALFHTPGKPIPENMKQYFAVYYVKTDSDKPVRELWKNAKKHDGVKRVFITFEKLPKKDKKEEKKGDKEDKKEKDEKKDDKKEKADKKDDCEKQNTEEKKDTTEEKKEEKKEDEKEKKEEKKDDEEKK